MPIPIVWVAILQAGTASLASGFGRRLGEDLGSAAGTRLAGIIFGATGSTSNEWQQEVGLRLSRIEQKIDSLFHFCQSQLPALVHQQVEDVVVNQRVNDIKAARIAVAAKLVAYADNPSPANKASLRESADDMAELGLSVGLYGPAWHAACLVAFTSLTSAYSRLLADDHQLLGAFKVLLAGYQDLIEPWFNPEKSRSIAEVLNSKSGEYVTAKILTDKQPIGNFLLGIAAGPFQIGSPHYQGPSPAPTPPVETYIGYKAWIEKSGNMWGGTWSSPWYVTVPVGTTMNPSVFVQELSQKGWKILDFFETPTRATGWAHSAATEHMDAILSKVNDAQRKVDALPPLISELNAAYYSTRGMLDCCRKLLELN